jgi:ketosteroid isomerase-like protein
MNHARITRLIALPVTILVLAGVTAATLVANAGTGTGRSAADQVRTAERTLLRAAVDGDIHTAGALLAPDLQLIDVTGTPETRTDYLANIGGGIDFVTLKPIKPISVRVFGDNAVARVKLKFKVVAHGQTIQHEGWTTDLFQRSDGRWKVVWSQSTAIPDHLGLFIRSLQP